MERITDCIGCGKPINGFSMRSVFLVCRECVAKSSSEKDIDEYLEKVDEYIRDIGEVCIAQKLLNILQDHETQEYYILLNNNLFKDSIYKIFKNPFNMIKEEEVIIFIRNGSIDDILEQ